MNEFLSINNENALCPIYIDRRIIDNSIFELISFVAGIEYRFGIIVMNPLNTYEAITYKIH